MKRTSLFILSLLICPSLILFGCDDKDEGGPVENLHIYTLNDGVSSLNPLLTWDDDGSKSYSVTIDNKSISDTKEEAQVSSPFSLGGYLEPSSEYTVTIKDKRSNQCDSVTFTTISEGSKMDSISTFLNIYGAFSDNMVIQRDKDFKIKGFVKKGNQVTVMLDDEVYTTTSNGDWEITIPAHEASLTPKTLKIIVSNQRQHEFKNVVFGDVFLVAGQSNIQWPIKDSDYEDNDLNIDGNKVRFFAQSTMSTAEPSHYFVDGRWFIYDRNDSGNQLYSAICLMLGSMLGKELKDSNVPIGIMYAAQGDTNISKWMDKTFYNGDDQDAGIFFNSMIHPFEGLNVKGVVWYQGCNDSSKAIQYKNNLLDLMSCYRNLFNDLTLPFYVVQLPCFSGDEGNKFNFAYVRDAQYKACLEDEYAYLIATCDGGDPGYIHPSEKRYICERLTMSILAVSYGASYLKEGPSVNNVAIEGNKVILSLNNADGLHSDSLVGFELSGEDGRFYDATAIIVENKIEVTSTKVLNPVYVRYGFSRSPFLGIYNKDGYLMSPFRNDDYDKNIDILDYDDPSLYKRDPNGANHTISINNNNLVISKPASQLSYCASNIYRWSPVNHTGTKFRFVYQGTNSGVEIQIRFIESSYEIWSFSFMDDSSEKTIKEATITDNLICTYNQINNFFNYESIMQVGVLIKGTQEANITIFEARFI